MLDYWRDVHGQGSDPHAISYRAMSPVYAGETYQIRTSEVKSDESGRIWEVLAEKAGKVCVKGEITAK
jgi:hydroxyacyl-ACP dehydratase HTD2-like protein with hotdog domain